MSQKSAAEMSMTTGTKSADKISDSLKEVEVVEEELSNRKIKEMLELLCDEAVSFYIVTSRL